MSKQELTKTDKLNDVQKTDQTTIVSNDTAARQQINMKMVQNVLLIWLDSSIDEENNADCRNTVMQLRQVVNNINIFRDDNQCIQFLEDNSNEKVYMIISGSFCQHILPRIHNTSQLDSIFIFCDNKQYHEQWAKEWSKIWGVFTEITLVCDGLQKVAQRCEHNSVSISIMNTNSDISNKNFDQLDPTFMYTQILKEILLTIKFEGDHIKEFIKYCKDVFADNKKKVDNIKEFERKYHQKTPIWWYTCECFLYSMINRGIRTMDGDIIIKMGFFINDLHRQIEQLHQEQFLVHHSDISFTVFRGQGLSRIDFDQLKNSKGSLLSFNNFLSTSKDRNVSLFFAESNQNNPDLVGILFVMTINPSQSTTPFAFIDGISYFPAENEVLFSMHTIFRICDIKPLSGNIHLFQVDLTLTSDNDKDLRILTDCIRQEIERSTGWARLGELLFKMGQTKKAQEIYEVLLNQTISEREKGNIYNQLGMAKRNQGEYKEAKMFYKKSFEICKRLSSNHPGVAAFYNNIGNVYYNMGEYFKALSYYKKTLKIRQQSLPSTHPSLAMSYNNIGLIYDNMGEYSKAISYYEKALEIRQKSLPSYHPDLASTYNNIGLVYDNMSEYSKALASYEKALEIKQKSLPSNHSGLGSIYNNIGLVYNNMGEYSRALSYYEKALEIKQQSLSSNHPSLAASYDNIGLVYTNMGEYSKALVYYEKALEISKTSLPSNHPDLALTYNNIGLLYNNMGEYSKAYLYYERAVDIGKHSLPSDHRRLIKWRKNLDLVKQIVII